MPIMIMGKFIQFYKGPLKAPTNSMYNSNPRTKNQDLPRVASIYQFIGRCQLGPNTELTSLGASVVSLKFLKTN